MNLPGPILNKLLDGFYDTYLTTQFENAKARREDCRGLVEFAETYDDLDAFLADVSLASEFAGDNLIAEDDAKAAVVLSTVHQAKGLEWDVVFIPWLVEGRFPVDWTKGGLDEEEEERRIFHVAVTRARNELYLTVPRTARRRGKGPEHLTLSVFLKELDPELVEPLYLQSGGITAGGLRRPGTGEQPTAKHPVADTPFDDDCDDFYYDYDDCDTL